MSDGSDSMHPDRPERVLTREELLRRGVAGGVALSVLGGQIPNALGALAEPAIKRGGTFRVGVQGGSDKEVIDAQTSVLDPDAARLTAIFDGLLYYDENYKLRPNLATQFTSKDARTWTIRVRKGVQFHNGKTLTADDVVWSIRRMLDKSLSLYATAQLSGLRPANVRKVDKWTVRLILDTPNSVLPDAFGQYFMNIVPIGYTSSKAGGKQIGTGPYTLTSFTPGNRSELRRNPNYWRHGQPYFDRVVILDLNDDVARVNALLGGQVDAITAMPFAQISAATSRGLKILNSQGGGWVPICMAVDQAPFTDVRVRQAFRLIANRPQLVQQAFSGYGRVGNDVYSPLDACYDAALPPRHQDIAQAKSLLKAAGQDGLKIDLATTNGRAGQVECAQVFAQQAQAAGVTINVKNLDATTFYGSQYLKYPFSTDYWGTRNYLNQVAAGSLSVAPYNETHWNDPKFVSLYNQALRTVDQKKRCAIVAEMQNLEYTSGGYIVWGFYNLVDAFSPKVQGFKPSKGTLPLGSYGNGFRTIAFK
jgi:peptide/nickel transport system substrate-binding protein